MSDSKDKSIGSDQASKDSRKNHNTSGRLTKNNGLEEDKANATRNKEEDADEESQIPGTNNLW